MSLEIQIDKKSTDIPSEEWVRALRRDCHTGSDHWTRLVEYNPKKRAFRYEISVLRDGQIVAGLQAFVLDDVENLKDLYCGPTCQAGFKANGLELQPVKDLEAADWLPLLMAKTAFHVSPGDMEAVTAACEGFYSLSQELGARLSLFPDLLSPEDDLWLRALEQRGVLICSGVCDTIINIEWTSIEEYFRWLGSGNLRREYASMQKDKSVQFEILEFNEFPDSLDLGEVLEALSANETKYSYTIPVEWKAHFLCDSEQTKVLVLCKDQEGKIKRIAVLYRKEKELFLHRVGGEGRDKYYFMVAYYLPLKYGIENGLRRMMCGTFPVRPKIARGAHLKWIHTGWYSSVPEIMESVKKVIPGQNQVAPIFMEHLRREYQRPRNNCLPLQGLYDGLHS